MNQPNKHWGIVGLGVAILAVVAAAIVGCASAPPDPKTTNIDTEHGKISLADLANVQPGLGTIMLEYSTRYYRLYYAAKAGNWDLADYELAEQREIQEVGETTRPTMANDLKKFESAYLDPLDKAIKAQDWKTFEAAYNKGVQGCNECHAASKKAFIKYVLPSTPPDILQMTPP